MSIWNDDCPATAPAQADGLEVVMEAIRLRPDGAWCHLYSDEARGSRRGDPAFQVEPLVLKSAADARDAEQRAEIERLRGLLEEARRSAVLACDLLAERTHGIRARSPAHNARILLEDTLTKIGEPR